LLKQDVEYIKQTVMRQGYSYPISIE